MKNKLVFLALVVLLATASHAQLMDTTISENIVDGKSVLVDDWASITVSPSVAYSLPRVRNFTQTIDVCNLATDAGYLYFNYFFDKPLKISSLTYRDMWVEHKEVITPEISCTSEGVSPNNVTTCEETGTTNTHYQDLWHEEKTILPQLEQLGWAGKANYVNKQGTLFQAKECKQYVLNYQPAWGSNEGKWNFQVWGNIEDDWTCVEKNNCPYSYTLDPTFSSAFSYKKNIQFNITTAYPAINNYTVQVIVNSTSFDMSVFQADMDDVLFANFDETVQLGCYKESGDSSTFGNYSVLLTNFSNATNTSIWMYYSNNTAGMVNQCPDLNNAVLIADNMNSTSINTSIWNELVGVNWGVASGGAYNSSSSTADACSFFTGGTANNVKCLLMANTTGVLKQSQAYQVALTTIDNMTQPTACGWGAGWSANETTNSVRGQNVTVMGTDDMLTRNIVQNGTNMGTGGAVPRATFLMNSLYRKINNNNAVAIYSWLNSTSSPALEVNLATISPNASTSPNDFLNNSNKFFLFHADGSGGVQPCNTNSGIIWYGMRMTAFLNATPSQVNGSQQAVANPAIALSVTNETWEPTGSLDAGGISNFSINVTIDQNTYNNISQVNFSINGITYRDSQVQNQTGGVGQTNWTRFNISIYTPLVQVNATTLNFNWSFTQQSNTTANTTNSSNRTLVANWGWWVNNFTYVSPITMGRMNNIFVNFTKYSGNRNPIGMNHNVTLEWNQTNRTTTVLFNNQTNYEEYNTTFITPTVSVQTSVQMKGWLNMSFNGSFVTRDPNATQILLPVSVNSTQFWESPVPEVGRANFSLAVNWSGVDVNNITNVNFTYNNTVFLGGITNTSVNVGGNVYQTTFNITLRPNLTQSSADNYTFRWNITADSNASNVSLFTSEQNQSVTLVNNITNVTWTSPVVEGTSNSFTISVTNPICETGVETRPTTRGTIEYNGTNRSQVSDPIHIDCATPLVLNPMTMTSPLTNADVTVPWVAWTNYTFQGLQRNRNSSNQTQRVLDEGGENNQTYNTPIFETSLANFTINITNITAAISIVNFTWNATLYNSSNITNVSTGNYTVFNITIRIPLVPSNRSNYTFQWNWTIAGGGSNKSSNLTNQSVNWAWYPNDLDLQPDIYELFPQTAGVNVTKHLFMATTVDSVNLEYNQSNRSTSLTSNQTYWEDWNVTFITPGVPSDLSVQARGILNISFGGVWYLRFTSNASQLIRNVNLSCGACFSTVSNFTAVLNFSFFDEFSNASIRQNGSDQITIWTTLQSVNQTFGCNFVNVTFHEFCIQNLAANFTANFNVQYGSNVSNLYPIRELWKRQQQISNQTANFSLYNLLSVNATEIVVTVQDAARIGLRNMIVEAHKYNISNNSYMLVDSGITDFDGKTRLQMYKADDYYRFIVRDGGNNVVLRTSQDPGFKLLFTEYFLVVTPTNETTIQTIINIAAIQRNLTWDNGTKTFALSYLDLNNVTDTYCFEVFNTSNYNSTILNKQCSSNRSASFSFILGDVNGTYLGTFSVGGNSILVAVVQAILNVFRTLGKDAYFGAFILVGTLSAAGLFVNPAVGLALLATGMTGLYWMQLIPISWYAFAGLISVIVIVALVVRKSL